MSWPKEEYITCIGFSKSYLPALRCAIDRGAIKWIYITGFAGARTAEFEWIGCKWSVEEISEYVVGLTLLEGTIDPEALTVEILRC